jgi:GNAT superfamily N-acetyltransferase
MHLAELTEQLEQKFLDYVKRDYCDYYFFIYDWQLQKSKTKIYLALEGEAIVGLLLIYEGNIVQLRGEPDVVCYMLDKVAIGDAAIQAPLQCERLLVERYPAFKQKEHVELLNLKKFHAHLSIKVRPQRLGIGDTQEIETLMHESYSKMWSDITAEYIKQQLQVEQSLWLGIRNCGRLVSFGYATLTPVVSHITWIATHPKWQNRGYATSIVSALVEECLRTAEGAVIYVMEDNADAKAIYLKVGFKPYKAYLFLRT